jgi:ribonuclease Z
VFIAMDSFHTPSELPSSPGIRVITVKVDHCPDAHALIVEHTSGAWKIAFSGDCRPSAALVSAGAHATVLVHEATFSDEMSAEAKVKKHSTAGEAIDVGKRMAAEFVLLTHFSQRYPKLVPVSATDIGNVGVAFDQMAVSRSHLAVLPRLLPALGAILSNETDTEDE